MVDRSLNASAVALGLVMALILIALGDLTASSSRRPNSPGEALVPFNCPVNSEAYARLHVVVIDARDIFVVAFVGLVWCVGTLIIQ